MSADNPARPAPGATLCALEAIKTGSAIALDFAAGEARFSMIVAHTVEGIAVAVPPSSGVQALQAPLRQTCPDGHFRSGGHEASMQACC